MTIPPNTITLSRWEVNQFLVLGVVPVTEPISQYRAANDNQWPEAVRSGDEVFLLENFDDNKALYIAAFCPRLVLSSDPT